MEQITVTDANDMINVYQRRLEILEDVKKGDADPDSIENELDSEFAYSQVSIDDLNSIISALSTLGATGIRIYYAVNNNHTTIAIVGEDANEKIILPEENSEKFVYETFVGKGTISSNEDDLPV